MSKQKLVSQDPKERQEQAHHAIRVYLRENRKRRVNPPPRSDK